MEQCANNIFMVEPANFGYNAESATSNYFQKKLTELTSTQIQEQALIEFNRLKNLLIENGINVSVFKDSPTPLKPDAIFPNNWISINNNKITIYPMCNENRRIEKRKDIINTLQQKTSIKTVLDLSHYEKQHQFLEGTGSIIFDHSNKIAYACVSERTNIKVLAEICKLLNYTLISFTSLDENNNAIYHTNVMMSIAPDFAIVCLESITNPIEREKVQQQLLKNGKEIIDISLNQVNQFAGNMLTLNGSKGLLQVMSKRAYDNLTKEQLATIKKYAHPLIADIPTIESVGGGSVRCMIAEIFT